MYSLHSACNRTQHALVVQRSLAHRQSCSITRSSSCTVLLPRCTTRTVPAIACPGIAPSPSSATTPGSLSAWSEVGGKSVAVVRGAALLRVLFTKQGQHTTTHLLKGHLAAAARVTVLQLTTLKLTTPNSTCLGASLSRHALLTFAYAFMLCFVFQCASVDASS